MQEQASQWTPRQREVLELIADGYTNREIAERLGISLDGAKWHVSEIISKLGVQSREDAAQLWLRERRRHWPSRMFKAAAAPLGWAAGAVAVAGIVALVLADLFTSEGADPSQAGPQAAASNFTGPVIMSQRRHSHVSAVLPDGRVVILGGRQMFDAFADEVEVFNPSTNTFSSARTTIEPRHGFAAVALRDGRVLLTGGLPDRPTSPPGSTANAEIYDPVTDTYLPTGAMTTARAWHIMTLLADGRVLVVGGAAGGATEIYDPDSGTFSAGPALILEKLLPQGLTLRDGSVLITGSGTAERYDPANGTVEVVNDSGDLPDIPALLPDGQVLLTGGIDHEVWRETGPLSVSDSGEVTHPMIRIVDRAVILDPFTGEVTEVERMNSTRGLHKALRLPDGRILLAGGVRDGVGDEIQSGDIVRQAEIFDPTTGRFTPAMALPEIPFFFTIDLLPDGRVLVVGANEPWPLYAAHVYRP